MKSPKILVPNRALDFGIGFYTTANRNQAENFAQKVLQRNHSAAAFVSCYEVDIDKMKAELNYKWFDKPDGQWLDFVADNRNGTSTEKFDFVYGLVANDTIFKTFIAYQNEILLREETIERLKVHELYNQLTFCNEKALSYLNFVKAEKVV